ncbi:hypothetical protein TRFO_05077 [Tritrichomonas foetus]|uniref:Uncharacterized protein n=1 Tax=Tritrichomonas foetus TaxID=1144522 RepID=A0A1J4KE95_9EUKA|nr:hypothetical protein TRFO_05077 [Tritrichomonas foetus]|eukprot:OHT07950.1 hypothetical protein TRFO_05077 [Tritrichomonas foetus]
MSSKQAALLLWDCSLCPSQNVEFVQQIARNFKLNNLNILVCAKDQKTIPPSVSDLSIAYPVTCRFGPNAIFDTMADVVGFLAKCKNNCTFVLISTNFPIWINLFQRASPKMLVFVSSVDPRTSLDFSFLPPSISINILKWPNLESLKAMEAQPIEMIEQEELSNDELSNDSDNHITNQDEQLEVLEQDDTEEDDDEAAYNHQTIAEEEEEEDSEIDASVSSQSSMKKDSQMASTIQPLANIEKYNIDLRSPAPNTPSRNSSEMSPVTSSKRPPPSSAAHPPSNGQTMSIPAKFQPLIEAMKSIGKAMISLSDLEGQLKVWCNKLNEPIENTNTYIAKASDAGIIIYDKSINYVRFRNRQMANANIEYV